MRMVSVFIEKSPFFECLKELSGDKIVKTKTNDALFHLKKTMLKKVRSAKVNRGGKRKLKNPPPQSLSEKNIIIPLRMPYLLYGRICKISKLYGNTPEDLIIYAAEDLADGGNLKLCGGIKRKLK